MVRGLQCLGGGKWLAGGDRFKAPCGEEGTGPGAGGRGGALQERGVGCAEGVLGLESDSGSPSSLPGVPGRSAPRAPFPYVENVGCNLVGPHIVASRMATWR